MSSPKFRAAGFHTALALACAAGIAALSGCGFKPLYGVDSAAHQTRVSDQFAQIDISPIANRIGQEMRNMLIDSLHPGGPAPSYKYRLNVAIREQDVNLGLQQNSIATRGQVRITVQYFLEDTTTGKTLLKESLRSSTGYDILVDQFGSLIANQNAQQNGLQQIANDMTQHLALYFSQQK